MFYINICQATIKHNMTCAPEDQLPPIRICDGPDDTEPLLAFEVRVMGTSRMLYSATEKFTPFKASLVLVCDDVEIVK